MVARFNAYICVTYDSSKNLAEHTSRTDINTQNTTTTKTNAIGPEALGTMAIEEPGVRRSLKFGLLSLVIAILLVVLCVENDS